MQVLVADPTVLFVYGLLSFFPSHQCRVHHAYLDACLHYTGLQGLRKQRDLQPESNMRVVRLVCLCVWRVMLPQDPGYSQGTDARLERKVMHTAPLQPEPSSSGQRVRAHCFACVARQVP